MGFHPVNLGLRFLLEMAGLLGMAYWGWAQHEGAARFLWAIGLPLAAAVIWSVFNVPGDKSRSGKAPVPVPGIVRLILELAFFALAAWAIFTAGLPTAGYLFAGLVVIHYLISYDRIAWLLKH
ncbi:MAG: YrdB family protein [Candidatus Promineifilaceae bacterium]|nr:YrdB family protein [Candidatus Promineifilaceae bacterium]